MIRDDDRRHCRPFRVAAAAVALCLPVLAAAQTVYLCDEAGRSFAVSGGDAPPGCRALADPERDLQLSPAQPDLDVLAREVRSLASRVQQLETLLIGTRAHARPLPPAIRPADSFDTRGRMRDLGQDLDRRLDGR